MEQIKEIKIKKDSNAKKAASSIARTLLEYGEVDVTYVGAGAALQTNKAIAIARGFVAPQGKDLYCTIGFINKPVENSEEILTVMKFNCYLKGN